MKFRFSRFQKYKITSFFVLTKIKISPRSQASVDIAALIDKIDDVDQELRGIPDDTIKLVELIDELDFEETLSHNQNQSKISASTSFSASQTSEFEFDPLLEDIFFK